MALEKQLFLNFTWDGTYWSPPTLRGNPPHIWASHHGSILISVEWQQGMGVLTAPSETPDAQLWWKPQSQGVTTGQQLSAQEVCRVLRVAQMLNLPIYLSQMKEGQIREKPLSTHFQETRDAAQRQNTCLACEGPGFHPSTAFGWWGETWMKAHTVM